MFLHIWPGQVVKCGRVLYNRDSDQMKFRAEGETENGKPESEAGKPGKELG